MVPNGSLMTLLSNRNPYVEDVRESQSKLLDGYVTGRALSSRELVEYSLPLANVGLSMDEIRRTVEFLRGHRAIDDSGEERHIEPLGPLCLPMAKRLELARKRDDELARLLWREVGEYSDWFRGALVSIIDDRNAARENLKKDFVVSVDDIVIVPRLSWTGAALKIEQFYFWRNIVGLFGYTLMCLLDDAAELGDALRVCKYDACERIFLSFPPQSGGPRPSYCSPEHRRDALRESGAKRVADYRKRKARKAK